MPRRNVFTSRQLIAEFKDCARRSAWDACGLFVMRLYRTRLDGADLAELIFADGWTREHKGDIDNARRCYMLAVEKGNKKASRRLAALGGACITGRADSKPELMRGMESVQMD